ncbi:hypothetical protein [Leptothoe spongobia]|uniref:Uncharacterized protein n=1 Tax=Leptothoe spongobia TAU-MAC 1115 TaxID=1967444 RepID=A0A947DJ06_9CYAN|nr:hypothetical protein [Leptothoe spongobia]MBT9317509.1 hypothetical protein [Leptothoe spongobia TAU-MAC 1115]
MEGANYQPCGKRMEAVENSVENVWKILATVENQSPSLAIYDKEITYFKELKVLKALKFKNFS